MSRFKLSGWNSNRFGVCVQMGDAYFLVALHGLGRAVKLHVDLPGWVAHMENGLYWNEKIKFKPVDWRWLRSPAKKEPTCECAPETLADMGIGWREADEIDGPTLKGWSLYCGYSLMSENISHCPVCGGSLVNREARK